MTKYLLNSPDFAERLMRENLWTEEYTKRVIFEYVRFLEMAKHRRVAPSFEVDQVWHTHMLFSRDYTEMTTTITGKYLHHDPVMKTSKPSDRDEYGDTLAFYIATFEQNPPKDIWTDWKPTHYAYIDLNRHWVIPVGHWKTLIRIFFKHLKQKLWVY